MKRREFLALSGASLLLPVAAFAAAPLDYAPGLVNTRLAAGETLFLDFKASWCSTCAAQERRITALKAANPAYEENMTFINVDWDLHGRSDLVTRLGVPRRSTLVVLKGNQRLGMVVADTSEASIKQLLDLGLSAATA